MNLPLILNLLVFLALLFGLAQTRHTTWSLAKKSCSHWSSAWRSASRCTRFTVPAIRC